MRAKRCCQGVATAGLSSRLQIAFAALTLGLVPIRAFLVQGFQGFTLRV